MRRLAPKLGLMVLGILFALSGAELALRLFGPSYPRTVTADPVRGIVPRPDFEYEYGAEGHAHVRTNHEGFRDVEWAVTSPPATVRIAVLGDSFVAAIQVEKEDRFTERLAKELAERKTFGEKKVEVMNFGVTGDGTGNELLVLENVAVRYSPDVVILTFFTGNDVTNNTRALNRDSRIPYFVLRNGQLELDTSFAKTPYMADGSVSAWLVDHVRLVTAGERAKSGLWQWRSHAPRGSFRVDASLETGLPNGTFFEPTTPEWRNAWDVTEALVSRMNAEVQARGAKFLMMTVSPGIEADPDPEVRRRTLARIGLADLLYPDRRLKELGVRDGFPVLITGAKFEDEARRRHVFLYGFSNRRMGQGHLNVEGHRFAATLLADQLTRLNANSWAADPETP